MEINCILYGVRSIIFNQIIYSLICILMQIYIIQSPNVLNSLFSEYTETEVLHPGMTNSCEDLFILKLHHIKDPGGFQQIYISRTTPVVNTNKPVIPYLANTDMKTRTIKFRSKTYNFCISAFSCMIYVLVYMKYFILSVRIGYLKCQ